MQLWKTAFAALTTVTLASCGGGSSIGGLDAEATFRFAMTQSAQVPVPKSTTASGVAQIVIYSNNIDYELTGTSMIGVTMAHIHNGAPGIAGPIIVTLYSKPASGEINGVFATGSLSAATLPADVTLESLKALLLSGTAYVDVHTAANPNGEIRGQVK